jgi:predicted histone-like DNA-binding protein
MQSLQYIIAPKVNPRNVEGPRKYYAVKAPQGEVDVRSLAKRISRESMVGPVETTAVIEALLMAVPELLAEGKSVQLGEFGSFRLTLHSNGAESPEAFNHSNIIGTNLIFRAGKEFRDRLSQVKYTRANAS